MSDVEAFSGLTSPNPTSLSPIDLMSAPAMVLDNLYLGSVSDAYDAAFLKRHNIKHIVNAARECTDEAFGPKDRGDPVYEIRKSIRMLSIPLDDHPDAPIEAHFENFCEYISEALAAKEPVLVHCQVGVSRSAALVIAYYMTAKQVGFDEAFAAVKKLRPLVSPNIGFCLELQRLEERLSSRNSSMPGSPASHGIHGIEERRLIAAH